MRIELKAEIKGVFSLDNDIKVKINPYEIKIFSEDNRYMISISKEVIDYSNFITKYEIINSLPTFTLTNPEVYEDLIEYLQYIECIGAFDINIESINWNEPTITWIPEIEEEKGIMPMLSHKREKKSSEEIKKITRDKLFNMMVYRKQLKNIYIPHNYFKEAKAFFRREKYYFAYINYFMMLEYCFGNGKFKQKDVLSEFRSSPLLMKSISQSIKLLLESSHQQTFKWLQTNCKKHHQECDENGLVYLLVEYRGILSHAGGRSKEYIFNESKLFSITLIIGLVCFFVCGYLKISSFTNQEGREKLFSKS